MGGAIFAPAVGAVGLTVGLVLMLANYSTLTELNVAWVSALP
ncbi:hypothetical protein [Gordonia sp. i37]|nr:hypothetical protein [Gordonia sp. i37]